MVTMKLITGVSRMGDGIFNRSCVHDVKGGAYAESRYTVEYVSSPVDSGDLIVRLESGAAYRSSGFDWLYTIAEITSGIVPTARYHYDHVECEGPVMLLGVVEPVTQGDNDV